MMSSGSCTEILVKQNIHLIEIGSEKRNLPTFPSGTSCSYIRERVYCNSNANNEQDVHVSVAMGREGECERRKNRNHYCIMVSCK